MRYLRLQYHNKAKAMKSSFYLKLTISVISLTAHSYAMSTLNKEYGERKVDFNKSAALFTGGINAKQTVVNQHSNEINKVLADEKKSFKASR